jgi:hypothetical protein
MGVGKWDARFAPRRGMIERASNKIAQDRTRSHKITQDRTRPHKIAQDRTRSHKIAQDRTRSHKKVKRTRVQWWA